MNKLDRNVGKDFKVPVSKSVHRRSSTNQSCVQRSQNLRNFEKELYLRLTRQSFYCFMVAVLTKTFFVYLRTVEVRARL